MHCIDPEHSRRLQLEDHADGPGWRAHLAACAACRAVFGALQRLAAADDLPMHPAGSTLATYAEEPERLAEGTRRWIARHLEQCAACALALRAVPALRARIRLAWLRPLPLAAAAGWLLASGLGWSLLGGDTVEPFPDVHSLVLTAPRGAPAPAVPDAARFVRLRIVLGEETPVGAQLRLRFCDAAGRVLLARDELVRELDERDWPVLTLDRRALPPGPVTLAVTTPSGAESVFALRW